MVAPVLAAVAVFCVTGCSASRSSDPATVTLPAGAGEPILRPPGVEAFDAAYDACAKSFGFDPGGAQVLLDESGRPDWVKTGRDVPAWVHRPCLVRIGGQDPLRSSHSDPAG